MKLLLWNVEWASSRRVREFLLRALQDECPDVFCLTESTDFFVSNYKNTIASQGDYGYSQAGNRRKVWLVSRNQWTNVDTAEDSGLPPGRFASGVSYGIRFVGVCIPWYDAHVSTGQKNRRRWEDHLLYLKNLKPILADYARQNIPVCILGDFNQRIPATSRNADYVNFMHDAFSEFYTIQTSDKLDVDGEQLIDHVATSASLRFVLDRTIGRKADDGRHVSDHAAVIGSLLVGKGID